MQDKEPPPDPEEEPYDLDDEAYDLDDAPLDPTDAALLDLGDPPPSDPEDEPPIDLDDGPLVRTLDPSNDRSDLSDQKERERAIEEVLRDQARREVLRDIAYRHQGSSLKLRAVTGTLVAVALLVWIFPVPGFRAEIPFPMPPEEEEAALKIATWVQAQQVEAFRQQRGRLPDVLREAGEAVPGMSYERIDAQTYRVSGSTERLTVTWGSVDTLDAKLRESLSRLPGSRE